MKRITKVVAENYGEPCLWFIDDVYVGHDDQYDVDLEMVEGRVVAVELEKLEVPDELIYENDYEKVLELARTP